MEYEALLDEIGRTGPYQKRLILMVFLAGIPNAFPNLMFAFTQYATKFHCAPSQVDGILKNSSEYQHLMNYTIPWVRDENRFERSRCEMYDRNMSEYNAESNFSVPGNIVTCTNGWVFKNNYTVISEFNLVCGDSWKVPLATSFYMIGMGLGAFSGIISDRFGRRPVFLSATFLQFILTGLTGLSWNYESYAFFVLAVGLCGLVNYVSAFVLATETIGVKAQTTVAIICCSAYSVGYIISPLLGYLFPYWRWYLWSNTAFGFLYIPLLWLFPESLRWLLVSGKEKEAKQMIKDIAKAKNKVVVV